MSTSDKARDSKRAYAAPALTVYGSVRDITGAGTSNMSDASNTMM